MELSVYAYDRRRAAVYAREWAYGRNSRFYDFEKIGGDCTNFASQCIYAGTGVMNFTPTFGWYYNSVNDRSPSWTGVEYLHNFLTQNVGAGPFGRVSELAELEIGDIVQLKFQGEAFQHSPVVVELGRIPSKDNISVAAHSFDTYGRALSSYKALELRPIHILGYRKG